MYFHQSDVAAFEATMFLTTVLAMAFVHDSLLHCLPCKGRLLALADMLIMILWDLENHTST